MCYYKAVQVRHFAAINICSYNSARPLLQPQKTRGRVVAESADDAKEVLEPDTGGSRQLERVEICSRVWESGESETRVVSVSLLLSPSPSQQPRPFVSCSWYQFFIGWEAGTVTFNLQAPQIKVDVNSELGAISNSESSLYHCKTDDVLVSSWPVHVVLNTTIQHSKPHKCE